MSKINYGQLLNNITETQIKDNIPNFSSGDTVIVHNKITEGSKTRIQKFEGVVLRRKGSGVSETFTVRKESNGVWLEQVFHVNSPLVDKIELVRRGKVRRAYISYMRQRSGKSAKIKELRK